MSSNVINYQLICIFIILMICPYIHGKCSLNCGKNGRCVKTQISAMPEICICHNETYTNTSCTEVTIDSEEDADIKAINIHARRLVAVCEHSYCGDVGVCIVIDSTFGCICPDGNIAERCRSNSIIPLASFCSTGCANEGICNPIIGACTCPSGFTGTRCELARSTDLCRDITCRNSGVCNIISPIYATCWCLLGFHGDYCERRSVAPRCLSSKCYNGGTCYEHSPASSIFAYCLCRPGFAGIRCETEYFRCPNNGFYADAYGCAQGKYFECVEQTITISRSCPRGLRYNFFLGRCDYAVNVACPIL
ncbi:unnamed protein product [Rotaria magnacalcarata]|uniref:Uncharacterized protein n=2 Tax=Rotaria magnacalcarata TaxID=392030 RepID=A0A815Q3P9_9BILA|nr:unnamed protein product [Rotaria magnacalcarata]CAF1457823.1 unnamed protein product [Rotaria magnacalcarata]CAF2147387.1 unnamed protein product [Rotaria magnacalcarata]